MNLSGIAFNLLVILLPGIISSLTFEKISLDYKIDSFRFGVLTLLFSGISYLFVQAIYIAYLFLSNDFNLPESSNLYLDVWQNYSNVNSINIPYLEVLWTSCIGFLLGLLAALFTRIKLLNKIAVSIGISIKSSEGNLFIDFLSSDYVSEIYLRNDIKGISYHGFVYKFSTSTGDYEILLRNVDVYDTKSAKKMYSSPEIYLCFTNKEHWIIELPKLILEDEKK